MNDNLFGIDVSKRAVEKELELEQEFEKSIVKTRHRNGKQENFAEEVITEQKVEAIETPVDVKQPIKVSEKRMDIGVDMQVSHVDENQGKEF